MTALVEGLSRWVPASQAWRWALFVPGALQVVCGVVVVVASDDCPQGRRPRARPARGLVLRCVLRAVLGVA